MAKNIINFYFPQNAIAGFGGFKQVLTAEIFGLVNLPSFIVFDQLLICSGCFIIPNFLVYISGVINDITIIFKVGACAALIW